MEINDVEEQLRIVPLDVQMINFHITSITVLIESIFVQAQRNQNLTDLSVFYVPTCKKILKKIKKSYLGIKQDDIINYISNIYITISKCIQILNDLIYKLNILNIAPIQTNYFHSKLVIEQAIDSYKDIVCIFEEYMILLINRLL